MPLQFGVYDRDFDQMPWLGGFRFASAAATSNAVTLLNTSMYDALWVPWFVAGYGGTDIVSLRLNADTGANYHDRHLTVAAASTTLVNVETNATTLIRLAGNGVTTARVGACMISNRLGTAKQVAIRQWTGVGGTTASVLDFEGGGEWNNTTANITSITMTTAAGQTLNIGSGFAVYGISFPWKDF